MATQVQDDLAKIKGNLASQLVALRSKADQHHATIAELSAQLVEVQARKHQYETTVQEAQGHLNRVGPVLLSKQTALKLATGTSVEASATEALALVQADVTNHQTVYKDVSELLAGSTQEESAINAKLAEAQAALAGVVAEFNAAEGQRVAFHTQHANEARRVALFRLAHADEAVAEAKALVEVAQAKRAEAQDMLARDLAEWPGMAHDTLLEYGVFAPHAAEALLILKRQFIDMVEENRAEVGPVAGGLLARDIPVKTILDFGGLKEGNATLARQKAAGNMFVSLNPVIAHLENHLTDLDRCIDEIHQGNAEAQAKALVDKYKGQ